jgi:hypothetical protein
VQVPSTPTFAAACLGGSTTGTLKVCNTSLGNLTVLSIASSNPAFVVEAPSGGFPVTVSHDFCFPFKVTFTPTAAGPQTADLTITTNDPSFPTLVVTVTANADTSEVRVTGSTAFGFVSAWGRETRRVSMCNVGACPLTASSATVSCPHFPLIDNPLPSPLQPGACLDVEVGFAPTLPGPYSCALTLASTSPITPSVVRTLTARTPPAVAVHAGIVWPHGALGATHDHGSTLNVSFIQDVDEEWAWDVRFGVASFDGQAGQADVTVWHIAPNARYTFNPGNAWLVFANGGLGLYHFGPGSFEAGLDIGGGLRRPISPRFAVEATYNFQWAFTASPNRRYSQLQGGLVVAF